VVIVEAEAYSVSIIDANAELALAIAAQCLQPISWRAFQIIDPSREIKRLNFSDCSSRDIRESSTSPRQPKPFGLFIRE
jgi:hypothetical protein